MKWKGPLVDGLTYSLISKFLSEDPYRLYLYFVLGLEEYEEPHPNLVYGDTAHVGLEELIAKPYTKEDFTPEDWEDVFEAIQERLNTWPTAKPSYLHSIKKMMELYDDSFKQEHGRFVTEVEFDVPYRSSLGHEVLLRGKIDALKIVPRQHAEASNFSLLAERNLSKLPEGYVPSTVIGEHKFKGMFDVSTLRQEIEVDLQVSIYCYVAGANTVIYDNIRIPDTMTYLPPLKRNQSAKSYIHDLYHDRNWGDFPIEQKRHLWLNQQVVPISNETIEENFWFTIDPVIDWICHLYERWQDSNFDPQNPKHYDKSFFRKPARLFDASTTPKFKGRYYGLYTKQIDIEDLVPVQSFYAELKDQ